MLTLDDIRERLKDRRLLVVAEVTGIHANTLREVRDNPLANPTYKVFKSLNDYFSDWRAHG
jgi:ribosomal protein L10